jgi:16S rRNA (guanine527-N7)-methyltransferase
MSKTLVQHYFSDFSAEQYEKFAALPALYADWNTKINVVSRQDIENLEERHILHSLAIAKMMPFLPGAHILDLGTGGGFPGIPLAIAFPEVRFTLVDGTGKKILVVKEIAQALNLQNVTAIHTRVENLKQSGQFDFVVTRAVTTLDKLMDWSHRLLKRKHQHAYPNGLIALKGGSLDGELQLLPGKYETYAEIFPIKDWFKEPFFEEKAVVYVQG